MKHWNQHRVKNIALSMMILIMLAACAQNYPGMLYEVEENGDITNGEGTLQTGLPIMVFINDPSYITITEATSRGTGAFDDFYATDINAARWKDARFYVYGFLANNDQYTGSLNYNASLNDANNYTLLENSDESNRFGREARLSEDHNGELEWTTDGESLYSIDHTEYRYNFFAYYIDDLERKNFARTSNQVSFDVEIDGTQDLCSGAAVLTDKQKEELNKPTYKVLLANWKNLIYSSLSGYFNIYPIINIKHHLTRFKFYLKAGDELAGDVTVRDIYFEKTHNKANFIVAADDTTKVGLYPYLDGPTANIHLTEEPTIDEQGHLVKQPTDYSDRSRLREEGYSIGWGSTPYVVGSSIMLIPEDIYYVTVVCEQKERDAEGNPTGETKTFKASYDLQRLGDNNEPKTFEAGKMYNVTVAIYGIPHDIMFTVTNTAWNDGGSIDIDNEYHFDDFR